MVSTAKQFLEDVVAIENSVVYQLTHGAFQQRHEKSPLAVVDP